MMTTYSLVVIQLALGAFLLISSTAKLFHFRDFLSGVQEYEILPARFFKVFAILVVVAEGAVALSHLTGVALNLMAQCGVVLFSIFLIAIVVNLARKRQLPCYCFGTREGEMISAKSVFRLSLVVAAEIALVRQFGFSFRSVNPLQFAGSSEDLILLLVWPLFVLIGMNWLLSSVDILRMGLHIWQGTKVKTEEGLL